MSDTRQLRFTLLRIATNEFAIVSDKIMGDVLIEIRVNAAINFEKQERLVICQIRNEFVQGKSSLMIVSVSCFFQIEPEDWAAIYSESTGQYKLELPPIHHFASLTVGTLRGVLHTKTEGTSMNRFVIPPMDVTQIFKQDIIVKEGQLVKSVE